MTSSLPAPTSSQWQANGDLLVNKDGKRWQGQFRWQQNSDDFRIDFFGPLGTGHTRIIGSTATFEVTTADNQHYKADNAEQLLQQHLGWALPLSSLRYWIRGQVDPRYTADETTDKQQRLRTLKQRGWILDFSQYIANSTPLLPQRIQLESPEMSVSVRIRNWH